MTACMYRAVSLSIACEASDPASISMQHAAPVIALKATNLVSYIQRL